VRVSGTYQKHYPLQRYATGGGGRVSSSGSNLATRSCVPPYGLGHFIPQTWPSPSRLKLPFSREAVAPAAETRINMKTALKPSQQRTLFSNPSLLLPHFKKQPTRFICKLTVLGAFYRAGTASRDGFSTLHPSRPEDTPKQAFQTKRVGNGHPSRRVTL
jgi:hypothetical protein